MLAYLHEFGSGINDPRTGCQKPHQNLVLQEECIQPRYLPNEGADVEAIIVACYDAFDISALFHESKELTKIHFRVCVESPIFCPVAEINSLARKLSHALYEDLDAIFDGYLRCSQITRRESSCDMRLHHSMIFNVAGREHCIPCFPIVRESKNSIKVAL